MNNSNSAKVISAIIGLIVFIYIAQNVITSENVPAFGTYMASSTEQLARIISPYNTDMSNKPVIFVDEQDSRVLPMNDYATTSIALNGNSIIVQISNNPSKRELGLSYRVSLPEGAGMLFIFPQPGRYGFWMKDMKFPIDMVWIRPDRTVTGITENVAPDTYPEMFYPPDQNTQFVLELNAGDAKKYGIEAGTVLKM
ncbi:MAG: DUF192 domain-containing protein [Patescibacteria group bacterium]|nr:DUF192 domain-containing protein [Patescibacteria group bacterium]